MLTRHTRWFLYDSLVTVLVAQEPENQWLNIHKNLVCSVSDFFSAALTGSFKEADGTITLPEQDPETFKYFIHWLYTGDLRGFYYPKTVKTTIWELSNTDDEELKRLELSNMCDLPTENEHRQAWELATYQDAPFQPLVALYVPADTLQVKGLETPIISTLIYIYGYSGTWINMADQVKERRAVQWQSTYRIGSSRNEKPFET